MNVFDKFPNVHHQIHVLKIDYHSLLIFQVLLNRTMFDNPENIKKKYEQFVYSIHKDRENLQYQNYLKV